MPISQQIGSSSLAKPGVCTSTTRPASPYEGQVIYETDTDKTLVWNGSAWVFLSTSTANPVGLEFVASTSFSATTTPFINGCFTSTYLHYRLMISISGSTGTDVRFRLRSGTSTPENGAVYDRWGYYNGATAMTFSNAANQTNGFLVDVANNSAFPATATIDIYNPNVAVNTNAHIQSWGAQLGNIYTWVNRIETTTQYTGFEMTADSGTLTGSIQVYGYRSA